MIKFYDAYDIMSTVDLFMPMCYLHRNSVELVLKAS